MDKNGKKFTVRRVNLRALAIGMGSRLSTAEKLVVVVLIDKGATPEVCDLSVNDVAWFISSTPATAARVLASLSEKGIVSGFDPNRSVNDVQVFQLDPFAFRDLAHPAED